MEKVSDSIYNFKIADNGGWLSPDSDLSEFSKVYVVNNSRSNKKLVSGNQSVILTAPGTEGGIQAIDIAMATNPHFVSMWYNDEIKVTGDSILARKCMSKSSKKTKKVEKVDIHSIIVEDIDNGGNENEVDVSEKAKQIVE